MILKYIIFQSMLPTFRWQLCMCKCPLPFPLTKVTGYVCYQNWYVNNFSSYDTQFSFQLMTNLVILSGDKEIIKKIKLSFQIFYLRILLTEHLVLACLIYILIMICNMNEIYYWSENLHVFEGTLLSVLFPHLFYKHSKVYKFVPLVCGCRKIRRGNR